MNKTALRVQGQKSKLQVSTDSWKETPGPFPSVRPGLSHGGGPPRGSFWPPREAAAEWAGADPPRCSQKPARAIARGSRVSCGAFSRAPRRTSRARCSQRARLRPRGDAQGAQSRSEVSRCEELPPCWGPVCSLGHVCHHELAGCSHRLRLRLFLKDTGSDQVTPSHDGDTQSPGCKTSVPLPRMSGGETFLKLNST